MREKLGLLSRKSNLAEAIRYALSRWAGLSLFLDDGRVEIDSNTVERAIRPLALNRKNALFAGSDHGGGHWAVVASLVETCKLNGVEPQAYLTDVITRIVAGHPQSISRSTCSTENGCQTTASKNTRGGGHHNRGPALARVAIGMQPVASAQGHEQLHRPRIWQRELHFQRGILPSALGELGLQPLDRRLGCIPLARSWPHRRTTVQLSPAAAEAGPRST